jgi:hypothetical protein
MNRIKEGTTLDQHGKWIIIIIISQAPEANVPQ